MNSRSFQEKRIRTPARQFQTGGNTMTETKNEIRVARNHKDRLFRMIFREKKELLSLYNAVNGTFYTNAEDLEIVTLENAIYMNMKNDLAFIMDSYLNLYEHQSTYSPNMPLRDLFYIAKELQGQVNHRDLYRNTLIKIPTPRFLVFYNGSEEQAEKKYLRLSDAFQKSMDDPDLELVVTMLNINLGKNRKLLNQCKTLKEYAIYVEKVRTYAKSLKNVEEAVDRAVTECINEGILREFLLQNRKEAVEMSIFEYDEEAVFEIVRKDEYEKGHQEGIIEGKVESIQPYGAFVDLGNDVTGLVHISQISMDHIKSPKEALEVGQIVKAKVIKNDGGKISLSIKDLLEEKRIQEEEEIKNNMQEVESIGTSLGSLLSGLKLD